MSYKLISRAEAQRSGERHFFTGTPCKYGHVAQRFVSTGGCVDCNTARAARFRKDAPTMFSYALHPDDVATVLAVCQACDLQRGLVPMGRNQVRVGREFVESATPAQAEEYRSVALGRALRMLK